MKVLNENSLDKAEQLQKLVDSIDVAGPSYRGAPYPPLSKYKINEKLLPDNMRFKNVDCKLINDTTIYLDCTTQEDFDREDAQVFKEEVRRCIRALAKKLNIVFPFKVWLEVTCRDGRNYGYHKANISFNNNPNKLTDNWDKTISYKIFEALEKENKMELLKEDTNPYDNEDIFNYIKQLDSDFPSVDSYNIGASSLISTLSDLGIKREDIIDDNFTGFVVVDTQKVLNKLKELGITEGLNQLKERAIKHKKKQKGISPFVKLDAGNVEHNIAAFNNAAGSAMTEDIANTSNDRDRFLSGNFNEDDLAELRSDIVLGSLYTGDYQNRFDIEPSIVQDFFDGFISYIEEAKSEPEEDDDLTDDGDNITMLSKWYNITDYSDLLDDKLPTDIANEFYNATSINISESLLSIDRRLDKPCLLTMYESANLTKDNKVELVKMLIKESIDAKAIYDFLNKHI